MELHAITRYYWLVLLVAACSLLMGSCRAAEAAKKPSILFCCPHENRYSLVEYDYMQSLVKAGFEVDYLEGQAALTWDRVKNYNVFFVYGLPPVDEHDDEFLFLTRPPWAADYFAVLDRFLKAGGGVFLSFTNGYGEPNHLIKPWGIWYLIGKHYYAWHTMPILWVYQENDVDELHRPPTREQLYRGLIGAQTTLSGGADTPITTTLTRAMNLPGLTFTKTKLTLQPGEYRVLSKTNGPAKAGK